MPTKNKEYTYRWREKYPERYNSYMRKWRKDNPDKQQAISKRSYNKVKDLDSTRKIHRKAHLKANFGLTLEEYDMRLSSQNGVCAICGNPETSLRRGSIKSLDVDHNHETGQIRGLLCSACNASLGLMREDPARLEAMIRYIEVWRKQ